MPGYQTFPYQAGSSDSLSKLTLLKLPALTGKSFLDVGCNEGFFCGYALFDGARKVVGIDVDEQAINSAKQDFPGCNFLLQSWDDLSPDKTFDVILCSSAIHYAKNQESLIHLLAGKLSPNGVLILEVGIAPGAEPDWVEVKRSIDSRFFPTRSKIDDILSCYASKYLGESAPQIGDPIPRSVFHIRKKKPYAFFLMQDSGAGKTTIRNTVFHEQKIISGDALILDIASGRQHCDLELQKLISNMVNPAKIDMSIRSIFSSQWWRSYLEVVLSISNGDTFVYDGYIPSSYHELVIAFFQANGFFPVNLCWENTYALGNLGVRTKAEARKYALYLAAMRKKMRRT
ncbi:class I SAM-dependent methyltransferase [Maridesulfovibrio hydrothermalis]|uniref:Methyltransferase type 11 n=1 Tax=Maridesulfovibrio hydrothermalis AM13 = DSM 14728 TaxID=1121451 RepID=L0RFK0_9BACT|nr:class I SAM-dependent methyltransferase [Maridesulfovibrio hydrothermalis]CCO25529.1 Methyltransferase type 11 [Maridesulfovibrio hydrothermalis AM13 = DSM 14728]